MGLWFPGLESEAETTIEEREKEEDAMVYGHCENRVISTRPVVVGVAQMEYEKKWYLGIIESEVHKIA